MELLFSHPLSVVIDTLRTMFYENDALARWELGDLPISSVVWEGDLPPQDAPPWVCLSEPGTPMVIRRYSGRSRTCDVISRNGRWLLESCLVSRNEKAPLYDFHLGGELALGDVQPGWCIVYAGHELWFPQRVLRVDVISDDVQRVWTLGDASTRDVWGSSEQRADWDNGIVNDWAYDEITWPQWSEGPWWPLKSEPLSENVRRFVLHKFDIAVECPDCGKFGQPIIYGLVLDPPSHVAIGGCGITGDDPDYVCECGCRWSITDQGRIHKPGEIDFDFEFVIPGSGESVRVSLGNDPVVDELNYDIDDPEPYGSEALETLDQFGDDLLAGAGLSNWDEEWNERDEELSIRYLGRDRYAIQEEQADEQRVDEYRARWLETDD